MKFMITCDEASTICDKSQYNESTFLEKLKLNFHLFICKACALYVKQNRKMSRFFKIKSNDCKSVTNCLSNADKELFKKELEKMSS
jgi:hypothetical protein